MRHPTLVLPLLCWLSLAAAEPSGQDLADIAAAMEGEYTVVGKKPDSAATYSGTLTFRARGQQLDFTRTIGRQTVRGTAVFSTVAGSDRIPVLKMSFSQDGRKRDGIYQWAGDYDNYFRFTGYVYGGRTKAAGLEALFPLPPSRRN